MTSRSRDVRTFLEEIGRRYDRRLIESDPVQFAHRYQDPRDQEIVALISALLAFGNAKAILASVEKVLDFLGPEPCAFLKEGFHPRDDLPFSGHRWVRKDDLRALFQVMKKVYKKHRSLEGLFLEGYQESDENCAAALHRFSSTLNDLGPAGPLSRGFRCFFPSPRDGSACKRLAMFLRWVVRPADGIDLGLWQRVSPAQLIVPLDTHVFQFAQRFRLSRYKTPNWKAAVDVTKFLKTIAPTDPLRYDFAICHYGMEVGY